jgi:pimeloyl-ACP methyl ester carboxylesterase
MPTTRIDDNDQENDDNQGRAAGRPTRRGVLLTAASAAAAGLIPAAPAAAAVADTPERPGPRPTVYVLVHGANGGGGIWTGLASELIARGNLVYAVDLPGHGLEGWFPKEYQAPQDLATFETLVSPLNNVLPADNVARVTAIVRRLAPLGPVVLVGQSLGGVTITGVADAVPHLVRRLVYLSAFCVTAPSRPTVVHYYGTPEGSTSLALTVPSLGDPTVTGAQRVNWRSADPAFFAVAKAAYFADGTDDQMRIVLNDCQPDESIWMYYTEVTPHAAAWGTVPRTFIRLTDDQAIPLALQDLMIADADALTPGNKFKVATVKSSHLRWIFHADEIVGPVTA